MPRYALRVGPRDYKLLDQLLSPGLFNGAAHLDAVIVEGARSDRIRPITAIRQKLTPGSLFLCDLQLFRMQRENRAPDWDGDGSLCPEQFRQGSFRSDFIRKNLWTQEAVGATHILAPAFYAGSRASPWHHVNNLLLEEVLCKVDPDRLYATICGDYREFCQPLRAEGLADHLARLGVKNVYALLSPIAATDDNASKLMSYSQLLMTLQQRGLSTFAARQPAFGLGLLALGVSTFDSGIAEAEKFDYQRIRRERGRSRRKGAPGAQPRGRRIYLPQLLTSLSERAALEIYKTSGLCSSFVCRLPCYEDEQLAVATIRNREHFLYVRLKEIEDLRGRPPSWRIEEIHNRLRTARQLADKVMLTLPHTFRRRFSHLDVWNRVLDSLRVEQAA